MQYRLLGNTGLRVSILGLGSASLGGVYGDVEETQAISTVHRAFELGVNVFDSSPYYGQTRGETVLGKGLEGLPRGDYVLMTKCGRDGPDDFDFSARRLHASIDESLARLQTDHVDILSLHDVEFGNLDQIFSESLPALREIVRSGKARFVGMTGLPLQIFRRALEARAEFDTVLSYCHATLFDQLLIDLMPDLQAAGIGVINASTAAMGLLSSHGPRDWHPAPADIQTACQQAADLCAQRGVELAELALQYSCALPGIATHLCGTASPGEITANVEACQQKPDPELLVAVQQALEPIRNRSWPQGLPENQDPPIDPS
ncbi:MAG: aldo/keto reductase [Planctomycetota bacterium]|nr:aldo/keto reductase [Planctomycetota bacterium]